MRQHMMKNLSAVSLPQIITERLVLRRMQIKDAEDMYAYASLPEVTRYLLWSEHPNITFTKRYLASLDIRYRSGTLFDFAIVCKENGKMIGTCGFVQIDSDQGTGEIGYVLNPAYWGQGYATEAVNAVLQFGFARLGLHRIEAKFMTENVASRRVMERCGMVFEGIHRDMMKIKGVYQDIGICARIES